MTRTTTRKTGNAESETTKTGSVRQNLNDMKYEIYRNATNRQFYWRLRARNGQIIAQGEGYKRKGSARLCIKRLMGSATARVVDLAVAR